MGCNLSKKAVRDPSTAKNGDADSGAELPAICPPRKTKVQLIPDLSVFKQLDDYVRKTPRGASKSLESLSSHLMAGCQTDLQKVRAIFCWIAFNITYDTKSCFSGHRQPQDVNTVLRTGQAVCQGYSQLFEAFCKLAGIPCVLVSGIAKGHNYDPEQVYTVESETNHAWNIVFVQGEWRPLDSTFGSGHLSENKTFKREFDEHWFLTDPLEFLPSHFPLLNGNLKESEKYQLMKRPVSIEDFSACIKPRSLAYSIGLKCLTHSRTIIPVNRDVTIKVKATRQPLESVKVTLVERGTHGRTMAKNSSNVLTSLSADGTCTIYVRPPRAVTYLLDIMGRARGQSDTNTVYQLLSYVIKCDQTHADQEPFPDKQGVWGLQTPMALECGLKRGKNAPFFFRAKDGQVQIPVPLSRSTKLKVELKHARAIDKDISEYTFLEFTKNGANISARLPEPGYYMLRVFASQHSNESTLQLAADFLLQAAKGHANCQSFPLVYDLVHQKRTKLLQPLTNWLPSGKATLFRIHAPGFGKLLVADKAMQMKNGGVWEAEVTPSRGQRDITVFAAVEKNATTLSGLYRFTVA